MTVVDDENCFFRFLSMIIAGNQQSYALIRQLIVSYMQKNSAQLDNLYGTNYFNDTNMAQKSVWASGAEIFRAAGFLKATIAIYSTRCGNSFPIF